MWKSWIISHSADQDKCESSIIFIVNKAAWLENILKYFMITLHFRKLSTKTLRTSYGFRAVGNFPKLV